MAHIVSVGTTSVEAKNANFPVLIADITRVVVDALRQAHLSHMACLDVVSSIRTRYADNLTRRRLEPVQFSMPINGMVANRKGTTGQRTRYPREQGRFPSGLTKAEWVRPEAAKRGGRPCKTDMRAAMARHRFSWLEPIWAVAIYCVHHAAVAKAPCLHIEIVKRTDGMKGFVVLPRRRVAERTFSWFGRNPTTTICRPRRSAPSFSKLPAGRFEAPLRLERRITRDGISRPARSLPFTHPEWQRTNRRAPPPFIAGLPPPAHSQTPRNGAPGAQFP